MKKYETFSDWAKAQNPGHRRTIQKLRKLMREVAPALSEEIKWGNGCWIGKNWPVVFLHCKDDHLQFGFFSGSALSDSKKLLQGRGRYVRHIKVFTLADIDLPAFSRLIRQAVRIERE